MDYHRGLNLEVIRFHQNISTSLFAVYAASHTLYIYVIVFQVRIARIFNTYGPRMCTDDGRVVSNFVAQVSPNTIFHIFLL